jgi:hypothetical protein
MTTPSLKRISGYGPFDVGTGYSQKNPALQLGQERIPYALYCRI